MVNVAPPYVPYGKIGGILTLAFLFLSSFYGSIFIYGPILPLLFIWPWLFRRLAEILGSTWQTLLVALYEKVYGVKIVVSGDSINRHEKTVVLLNHRTRLDWLYFYPVVFHSLILNRQKIALKSALKWPPGLGWGMQIAAYIFLDRNWETDQEHINKILSYFVDLDSKPNILFFPEGTDLSESNKRKSKEYAKKNGLTEFDYVLQPRTKGFTSFVSTLRNVSGIHAVHDVTVAYPHNIPIGELDLLKGEVPKEVHFYIKRHVIDELPTDTNELAKWCEKIWAKKEGLLRDFYSEVDPGKRKFPSTKKPVFHERSFLLYCSLFVWFSLSVFFTYLLACSSFARWYAATISLFYVSQTFLFGDFTRLEMTLYESYWKPRQAWGRAKALFRTTDQPNRSRREVSADDTVYSRYLSS